MKKCLMRVVAFSAASVLTASAAALKKGADGRPGELLGGVRYFDIVVSHYGSPEGDNSGVCKSTNSAEWTEQNKVEQFFRFMSDGVLEATESVHRIRDVRIHMKGKKQNKCDIRWWQRGPNAETHGSVGAGGCI